MTTKDFNSAMIVFAIPLIMLGIGMIYILYTRIKAIKGEEDYDLSNY